jgi:mRNA-degrading endonuclease toxin of MazEF toxin-antitoxin module
MKKIFGPYKGSKANGGRPIMVIKTKHADGTVTTTSTNAARALFEKATGKKLPKSTDVDHKNNKGRIGGKKNDKMSNLDALSHGKNVAKENRVRGKKK